jgi:hypothetical protein
MQPNDIETRRVIASDRLARLRMDAQPPAGRSRSPRARLGAALIAAGTRLSRGAAAPSSPGRARAARPW